MKAAELIEQCRKCHIALTINAGKLTYRGNREAIETMLPAIRRHKIAIIDELQSDDTLETLRVMVKPEPLTDEKVSRLLDRATDGLNLSRDRLMALLSHDELADIRAGLIPLETVRVYGELWASRKPIPDDDRRHCHQCRNLFGNRCMAAARGEIDGARNQHPFDKVPRRCIGYLPGPDDPDQRPGRERWPGLSFQMFEDG